MHFFFVSLYVKNIILSPINNHNLLAIDLVVLEICNKIDKKRLL